MTPHVLILAFLMTGSYTPVITQHTYGNHAACEAAARETLNAVQAVAAGHHIRVSVVCTPLTVAPLATPR